MDIVLAMWFTLHLSIYFFSSLRPKRSFVKNRLFDLSLGAVVLLCAAFLLVMLTKWSSKDVRSNPGIVAWYGVANFFWVVMVQRAFGFFGVRVREDVFERGNAAAAIVVAGQFVATSCCAAGANVGNGPGPEVVIFCAVLSTGSLLVLWILLNSITTLVDTITIERNVPAGIRVAGWFTATGVICGAAVTGDWHSATLTLRDFAEYGWPALVFTLAVACFERSLQKRWAESRWHGKAVSAGFAVACIALATVYVWKRGFQ